MKPIIITAFALGVVASGIVFTAIGTVIMLRARPSVAVPPVVSEVSPAAPKVPITATATTQSAGMQPATNAPEWGSATVAGFR